MARVLLIGIDPAEVDFSDPALPPGLDADVIRRGIARVLEDLRSAGHDAQHLYIPADPAGLGGLVERLAREPVACVVIGGGVRLPPSNLPLFEAVVNTVARASCTPAIALTARPEDAAMAVARVLAAEQEPSGPRGA
jgi:hypothetical protein